MSNQYVWLTWATAFLVPWVALYGLNPRFRRVMWQSSLATMPFGLTEPIFVPEYWNPPTVFNLAQRTGFDIESLIFCFAIGGIGVIAYHALSGRSLEPVSREERKHHVHRFHRWFLILPPFLFVPLYFLPWNPIYPSLVCLVVGAMASVLCRHDLAWPTLIGGLLFMCMYAVFMMGLTWTVPGYIESVWNLPALSGIELLGIPAEELAFGFAFGMYWSGIYEHLTWQQATVRR